MAPAISVRSSSTGEGFIGDRANKQAFKAIMDNWRGRLRVAEKDPFDGRPTDDLYKDKKALETIVISGDAEAAGVVIGSIEEFARELAAVIRRLLDIAGSHARPAVPRRGHRVRSRLSPSTLHCYGMSRNHPRRWHHCSMQSKSSGELGRVQPRATCDRSAAPHRGPGQRRLHPQRCRCARSERGAEYAEIEALGCADDRHRPRQYEVHEQVLD